jgi:hypothetical protein
MEVSGERVERRRREGDLRVSGQGVAGDARGREIKEGEGRSGPSDPRQRRPSRTLGALALIIAVLYASRCSVGELSVAAAGFISRRPHRCFLFRAVKFTA